MHKNAAIPMPINIFLGGSLASIPASLPKKAKYGNLSPTDKNVPTAAASSIKNMGALLAISAACMIMDLLVNPLKSGTPDIEKAAII